MLALCFGLLAILFAARLMVMLILFTKGRLCPGSAFVAFGWTKARTARTRNDQSADQAVWNSQFRRVRPLFCAAGALSLANAFALVGLCAQADWWVQLISGLCAVFFPLLLSWYTHRLIHRVC